MVLYQTTREFRRWRNGSQVGYKGKKESHRERRCDEGRQQRRVDGDEEETDPDKIEKE